MPDDNSQTQQQTTQQGQQGQQQTTQQGQQQTTQQGQQQTTQQGQQQTQQSQQPWYASIQDEEVRGLMEVKGYKDPAEAAKGYYNLTKLVRGSTDVIAIPKADDAEGWKNVYKALGRPDNPDTYDYGLPKEAQVDENFMKTTKGWFHEAGISNRQAAIIAKHWQDWATAEIARETAESTRMKDAAVAEIKQTYGKNFDAALARGQNAIKALGLPQKLLDDLEAQMGAPAVIALMTTLGDKIGNEDVRISGVNKEGFGQSKAELEARKAVMRGTPEIVNALTNPRDPNHLRYKQEWDAIVDKLSRM